MCEDAEAGDEKQNLNLIRRARAGDQAAMGQLVENYRNYMLLIANKNLGTDLQAKVGASDVVQQSLLNAQQHFEQFHGDDEEELKAWLRKILENDLLKTRRTFHTRKRDAKREIHLEDHSSIGRDLLNQDPSPSRRLIEHEKERMLNEAMSALSNDHRIVIQLRNFEQLSFDEIGKHMQRSADASRKLWSRAIQVLQANLADQEEELLTGAYPSVGSNKAHDEASNAK